MHIRDYLLPQHVVRFRATSKRDALEFLAELLSKDSDLPSYHGILDAIQRREDIMSTGIGNGLAVPHVRLEGLSKMAMAVGVLEEPIDYPCFDEGQAQVLVMILTPLDQHREYLKVLAQIVRVMKDETLHREILSARDHRRIHEIFTREPDCRKAG